MLVLKFEGIEMELGDKLTMTMPESDEGFKRSCIGEKFTAGIVDEITIEAKQHEWLEVYFVLTGTKDGKSVLESEMHEDEYEDDLWDEHINYNFLRYLIKKGAK